MPVFTISSFSTFAGLLVAGRKLATDPNPINWLKALADLAANAKALSAVLRDSGLTPLAAEMTRAAEETAQHFTHPGRARDDAISLFWQVAPDAFADPAAFAAAGLDAAAATQRMVTAIHASPHARDFFAASLPEQLFRQVAHRTLSVMLAKADYIAAITPDLWRETLRRHGVTIELLAAVKQDTGEILALVRELTRTKQTTVPQDTLIAMARKISPRIADRDEALRELDRAADIAANQLARGEVGSNVDDFVDGVLRRIAGLTREGRLDEAAAAADAAADHAEAGWAQLRDVAVNQHLLAFDAEGAARQVVRRVASQMANVGGLFEALRAEWLTWHDRGKRRGFTLELEVASSLARDLTECARSSTERRVARVSLGHSLRVLAENGHNDALRAEAIAAYGEALAGVPPEDADPELADAWLGLGAMRLSQATFQRQIFESWLRVNPLLGQASGDEARRRDEKHHQVIHGLELAGCAFGRARLCLSGSSSSNYQEAVLGIGRVAFQVGTFVSSSESLVEAVKALEEVLGLIPSKRWRDRGIVSSELGAAHLELAKRGHGSQHLTAALDRLQESVDAKRQQMRLHDDLDSALKNAKERIEKLGTTDDSTLDIEERVENLKVTVAAIADLVEIRNLTTEYRVMFGPIRFAKAELGDALLTLAEALQRLGEEDRSANWLAQAVKASREAVVAFEEAGRDRSTVHAREQLEETEALLARIAP